MIRDNPEALVSHASTPAGEQIHHRFGILTFGRLWASMTSSSLMTPFLYSRKAVIAYTSLGRERPLFPQRHAAIDVIPYRRRER